MFKCTQPGCKRKFSTESSLNSHRAWHTGILKIWKDAAKVRYVMDRKTWNKKGKTLVKGFLQSVINPDLSKETLDRLVNNIWTAVHNTL